MESRIETLRGRGIERTAYEELEFQALSKGIASTYPHEPRLAPQQFGGTDRRASKGFKARSQPNDGKRRRADVPEAADHQSSFGGERSPDLNRDRNDLNNRDGRGNQGAGNQPEGLRDGNPNDGRGNNLIP